MARRADFSRQPVTRRGVHNGPNVLCWGLNAPRLLSPLTFVPTLTFVLGTPPALGEGPGARATSRPSFLTLLRLAPTLTPASTHLAHLGTPPRAGEGLGVRSTERTSSRSPVRHPAAYLLGTPFLPREGAGG